MNNLKTPVHYITILEDYANQRIDNFLVTYLKGVPKTYIYRILRKGEVRVNKKRIAPSYRLQPGDELRIPPMRLPEETPPKKPGVSLLKRLADRIIYEDKNIIILNKPSGIPVHGGTGVNMGIIEAMRALFPKLPHLELAHRLDADTSGCLLLAKKRSILKEIHGLLRDGHVHKVYWALTQGHWQPSEYRVDAPLHKNQLSSGERMVRVDKAGKEALTVFKPLINYKEDATLVEATLYTGRTHQIRVHANYRRHPLAGDDKYGDRDFNKKMRQIGINRLFLHAILIEFTLPSTGQTIQVKAPLEDDLQQCLNELTGF